MCRSPNTGKLHLCTHISSTFSPQNLRKGTRGSACVVAEMSFYKLGELDSNPHLTTELAGQPWLFTFSAQTISKRCYGHKIGKEQTKDTALRPFKVEQDKNEL